MRSPSNLWRRSSSEGRTAAEALVRPQVPHYQDGAMSRHYHCGQYERAYLPARMNIWEGTTNRPTTVSVLNAMQNLCLPHKKITIIAPAPDRFNIDPQFHRNHTAFASGQVSPRTPRRDEPTTKFIVSFVAAFSRALCLSRSGPLPFQPDSILAHKYFLQVNERGHLINRKDKTPHFKKLPPEGDPGATPRRWPTDPSQHGPSGSQSFAYSPRGNMGYKGIPSNLGHTNTIYLPTKCTATNTKGGAGDVRSVNNAAGPYSPRNQAPWTTGFGPNATGVHTMRRPRSSSSRRSSRPSSSQKRSWR